MVMNENKTDRVEKAEKQHRKPGRKTIHKTDEELYQLTKLLDKSYSFLNRNFNSFTKDKKIYIALELIKKHMPVKLETDKALVQNNYQYVQIYRPEPYSKQDVETASRAADRSV